MRRAIATLGVMIAIAPLEANAYVIGSSFSDTCHEEITLAALESAEPFALTPPDDPDAAWYRHGDRLARTILDAQPTTASERLLVSTAVIGVRRPDLGDNGLVHIHDLRYVHLLDENQVRHFLRSSFQDGDRGQEQAAEDGRAFILALIDASADAYDADPTGTQLDPVRVWIEDYGHVDIEVWLPLYFLAQAMHVMQDSFTHTYRSEDTRRILAIQNYVDADDAHDEERDGPRHSDALDDCRRDDIVPLVESATQASTELARATQQYWIDRDRAPVEAVLDDWLTLEPGCTLANDYCGSPWVPIAKTKETEPLLGCSVSPGRGSIAPLALLAVALVFALRRRHGVDRNSREGKKKRRGV